MSIRLLFPDGRIRSKSKADAHFKKILSEYNVGDRVKSYNKADLDLLSRIQCDYYMVLEHTTGSKTFAACKGINVIAFSISKCLNELYRQSEPYVFTFGRFKGRTISSFVTVDELRYLDWAMVNCNVFKKKADVMTEISNHLKIMKKAVVEYNDVPVDRNRWCYISGGTIYNIDTGKYSEGDTSDCMWDMNGNYLFD